MRKPLPTSKLWLLVSLAACWLSGAAALAQPITPDEIEATFARGVAAADAGRWREAAQAFAEVCEVAPTSNALLNLATARYHQKQPLAALAALDQLAAMPDVTDAERRTADQMRARVGALVALLTVDVKPKSSRVEIDGRELSEDERVQFLQPGRHVVNASAEGYEASRIDVELHSGERRTLHLTLPRLPPAPIVAGNEAIVAGPTTGDDASEDDPRMRRRRRWLWTTAAVLLAGATAAVVATQVGGTGSCTTGSEGVALGGCAP